MHHGEAAALAMRTIPLLAGLLLATAFFAFVPSADASAYLCTSATSPSCDALVCTNATGAMVCSDPCYYQSDCCSYSFWCPETE